jgi:hypothetical protein
MSISPRSLFREAYATPLAARTALTQAGYALGFLPAHKTGPWPWINPKDLTDRRAIVAVGDSFRVVEYPNLEWLE